MTAQTSSTWIASVPRNRAERLAAMWDRADIEVLEQDHVLWLRGTEADNEIIERLRSVIGCERFEARSEGRLVPAGATVPTDTVPDGTWKPLRSVFSLVPPRPDLPSRVDASISPRLVRGGAEIGVTAVVTNFARWKAYVDTAPASRLRELSFAVSEVEDVIIRGESLAPVRGTACYETDGVICPCGWVIDPPLSAASLRRLLGVREDQLVLLSVPEAGPETSCAVINDDDFVAASRSAVRLTAERFATITTPEVSCGNDL